MQAFVLKVGDNKRQKMELLQTLFAGAALWVSSLSAASAHEGMWLPEQAAGLGAEMRADGLLLEPSAFADLTKGPMSAIVSLGGCSGSFVSPKGLVLTNHHCMVGSLQYNSSLEKDYLTAGFLAPSEDQEIQAAPGTRILITEMMRNVTDDILNGISSRVHGANLQEAIDRNRKRVVETCEKDSGHRCEVRSYYGGAVYYLQQQLEIRDVRLVQAPPQGIGAYGGEIDNWMWPRHTGDFGFYRAYVGPDGKPAEPSSLNIPYSPKSWLTFAKEGVKEGDFVVVAGYPGVTNRLTTAQQARFNFEVYEPLWLRLLSQHVEQIKAATKGNPEAEIQYASALQTAQNYQKKVRGSQASAAAMGLIAHKDAEEARFRAWIQDDPVRRARYSAGVKQLDRLLASSGPASLRNVRYAGLARAQLLVAARNLYRWAKESEKPDSRRSFGYQERDRPAMEARLRQIDRRFNPQVDRYLFENALIEHRTMSEAERYMPFEELLNSIGMDRLYSETQLMDSAIRLGWLDRPAADFEASKDPFIRLAVMLYPGDAAGERAGLQRAGRLQEAWSIYLEAWLAYRSSLGERSYPDANGTLRVSWGKVAGRSLDGEEWPALTAAEGMLIKNKNEAPFNLPVDAQQAIQAKDYGPYRSAELGSLPVDYISTVDITNGNSGSATLNAKGELVGVVFDGILDNAASDWAFNDARNRSIHVDSRFVLWALDRMDGADHILEEMDIKPAFR